MNFEHTSTIPTIAAASFDELQIGIAIIDPTGSLLLMNKMGYEVLGIEHPDIMKGLNFFNDPHISDFHKKNIISQKMYSFEMELTHLYNKHTSTSSTKKFHYTIHTQHNYVQNILIGYTLQLMDVTAERELLNKYQEQNELFLLALKYGRVCIWDWDVVTDDFYISNNFYEWFDSDFPFIIKGSQLMKEILSVSASKKLNQQIGDYFENPVGNFVNEFLLEQPGIAPLWVRIMGKVVLDVHNMPNRFFGIVMNINDFKKEEALLRANEKFMNDLLDNMITGFCVYEIISHGQESPLDYTFIYANKAFEQLIHRKNEFLIGHSVREILPEMADELIARYEDLALRNIPLRKTFFNTHLERYFEVIAYPSGTNQFSTLLTDVTDKMQSEDILRQTEKLSAIGQLAGGIAHDFNNQLMIISSFLQLIENFTLPPQVQDYLSKISSATERSSDLVKQLLAFSKKGKYEAHVCDLNHITHDISDMMHHTLDKNIQIKTALHPSPLFSEIDHSLIENALINLCLNARDAMRSGGKLAFNTDQVVLTQPKSTFFSELPANTYGTISIQDTGIGMNRDMMTRIFEPFFTTKENGTGLGLSAVFGTIKRHDGGIEVQSSPGEGTCFTIYLPICTRPHMTNPLSQSPFTVSSLTKNSDFNNNDIFIVDDEPLVSQVLQVYLTDLGYNVYVYNDPLEALGAYQKEFSKFPLVLLDVIMPGINGFNLLEEFIKINPKVQAIFLSGYAQDEKIPEMLTPHIQAFLEKPIQLKKLALQIANQ